ncbi:MBL fold metallo-hydrolase [Pseudomaricurvus alkylphenolicus]|uniref:MBL fold metallo-hydrolase n=1 Tax=Pseudomaricurvus alkylphenolicus TaxID=1306991 RepID=UPI001420CC56|nr:MBL fold metallo-hydrolase [Pseudomaricurvus alkylphenolicus]NIB42746.1 MBL fold metallo-hydrolase [Pseudomaricurvus alkylphenolicus]
MKVHKLASSAKTQWLMFGRDPNKPDKIIDTNQYLLRAGQRALLMDPGGIELFAPMLAAVLREVSLEELTDLFASHQDPDIISSLGLWDQALPEATLHSPWLWEGFIRHFGMNNITYNPIADTGGVINLGGVEIEMVPAHYLHSSGNFHIYDPHAKVLMSGDVGAALEDINAPMEVDNFDQHIPKMRKFHQRWMPSNRAKLDWINRVRQMDIDIMAPQHGRIFTGDNIQRFLDWFEGLEVGVAVS